MRTPLVKLLLLLALFAAEQLHAQSFFNAGIHSGANASRIPGFSNRHVFKLGYTGGVIIQFSDGFWNNVQLEINYTQKGALHKPDSVIYQRGLIELNYIEFPVLYQYNDLYFGFDASGAFEAGVAYGMAYTRDMTIGNSWVQMDKKFCRTYDVSILAGLGVHIGNHFMLRCRYQVSVLPILNKNDMPWSYRKLTLFRARNTGFQFSLVYMLRPFSN